MSSMRKTTVEKFNAVRDVVYTQGTLSPTEIQKILRSKGTKISRNAIYRYLKRLRETNDEWINDQAKAGYLETIRTMALQKKQRIQHLEETLRECPQPRTKAAIADTINNTEDSLRFLMESLPLLMVFRDTINGKNQDATNPVVIRD